MVGSGRYLTLPIESGKKLVGNSTFITKRYEWLTYSLVLLYELVTAKRATLLILVVYWALKEPLSLGEIMDHKV